MTPPIIATYPDMLHALAVETRCADITQRRIRYRHLRGFAVPAQNDRRR